MNMRSSAAPYGGAAQATDFRIGDAFPIIEAVYKNLDKLKYIAENAQNFVLEQIEFRSNLELEAIEWRYINYDWQVLCSFDELTGVDLDRIEETMLSLQEAVQDDRRLTEEAKNQVQEIKQYLDTLQQTVTDDTTALVQRAETASQNVDAKEAAVTQKHTEVLDTALNVQDDKNATEAAKNATELARDAALAAAGPLYATETDGRAAVTDGETFSVQGSGPAAARLYRRINGEVSVLLTQLPSLEAYEESLYVGSLPRATTREFFNDDGFHWKAVTVDKDGLVIAAVDEDGTVSIDKTKKTLETREFFNDDSFKYSDVLIDGNKNVVVGWEPDGRVDISGFGYSEGEQSTQLLPYVSNGKLHAVAAADEIAADLGSYSASAIYPGNDKHVRALINWPSINAVRSVAAAPSQNILVPDAADALHVVIGVGQSLMVGANSENTMISTQPILPEDVLMFKSSTYSDVRMGQATVSGAPASALDGDTLIGFEPLVAKRISDNGNRGETILETLSNSLSLKARSIGTRYKSLSFISGIGGSTYAQLKKGNQIYENMLIGLRKAKVLAEERGLRLVVDGVVCKHGESGFTDPNYKTYLQEWRNDIDADVKAITGQQVDVHFLFSQPSTFSSATANLSSFPAAVRAMLELHNEDSRFHLACADYSVGGDDYHTDYLHMLGPGYAQLGAYYAQAWEQALWGASGRNKITQMLSATRAGNIVTINYEVPVAPLQIDTVSISEVPGYGYRFFDSTGEIVINSVSIGANGTSVVLVLAAVPSGVNERVDYALTHQTNPRTYAAIPRGNISDSSSRVSIHGRAMKNWAVHQSINL